MGSAAGLGLCVGFAARPTGQSASTFAFSFCGIILVCKVKIGMFSEVGRLDKDTFSMQSTCIRIVSNHGLVYMVCDNGFRGVV